MESRREVTVVSDEHGSFRGQLLPVRSGGRGRAGVGGGGWGAGSCRGTWSAWTLVPTAFGLDLLHLLLLVSKVDLEVLSILIPSSLPRAVKCQVYSSTCQGY